MNAVAIVGFRFDQLVVTEEVRAIETEDDQHKKVVKNEKFYFLVFPLQKEPVLCPQGIKPSKAVDSTSKPGILLFMGFEFKALGYDSINGIRIYKVQHPNDETLILKFTVKYPGNMLREVQLDYKSPI